MSDFYRKLDEAEIRGRAERMVGNRPENLHDYQGCANSAAQGLGPCGLGPLKWFRCFDCGYSGEITTEEIAAHRSLCARGTTEPLAEQARAAEQAVITKSVAGSSDSRPYEESVCKNCGKAIWRITDGLGKGWMHRDQLPNHDCVYPRTHAEPVSEPAQPPAGDVVERMWAAFLNESGCGSITNVADMKPRMTAALAVAREGYVSLEDAEDIVSTVIMPDPARELLIKRFRNCLAKPAERVTDEQKVEAILRTPWIDNPMSYHKLAAEIVAALRDGKEGK